MSFTPDLDQQLSAHFTLRELVKSPTALRLHIDNTPSADIIAALRGLAVNVLEPLRKALGRPVHINSGYRSMPLNQAVGGSRVSQHIFGEAADIEVQGFTPQELQNKIGSLGLPVDQCIAEPTWVHVSHRMFGPNRRQYLEAHYENGKVVYQEV